MFPGYDWMKGYQSIQALEADLNGFQYKGEGWYINSTDTVLVFNVPTGVGGKIDGGVIIYVWNTPVAMQDILHCLAMNIYY